MDSIGGKNHYSENWKYHFARRKFIKHPLWDFESIFCRSPCVLDECASKFGNKFGIRHVIWKPPRRRFLNGLNELWHAIYP